MIGSGSELVWPFDPDMIAAGAGHSRARQGTMSDLPDPIPAATLVLMRERARRAAGAAGDRADRADGVRRRRAGLSRRADRRRRSSRPPSCLGMPTRRHGRRDPRDDRGDRPRARRSRPRPTRRRPQALRDGHRRRGAVRLAARRARPRARPRGADAVRALVPQFPRDAALRHACSSSPRRRRTRPSRAISEHEAVRAFWASAAEILAEVEAGRAHAIFPTRRNLERLARFALDRRGARRRGAPSGDAGSRPGSRSADGAPHVCIPEGIGYPVTSRAAGDGAAALMRLRRGVVDPAACSLLGGARCSAALLLYGHARRHPEDLPWTALDLAPAGRRLHRPQARRPRRRRGRAAGRCSTAAGVRFTALPAAPRRARNAAMRDAVRFAPAARAASATGRPISARNCAGRRRAGALGAACRAAGGAAPFRPRRSTGDRPFRQL